jgi:hypothetical protein
MELLNTAIEMNNNALNVDGSNVFAVNDGAETEPIFGLEIHPDAAVPDIVPVTTAPAPAPAPAPAQTLQVGWFRSFLSSFDKVQYIRRCC